jgi:DNA-binding transcriptional regulator YhcF (GntR family)
MLIYVHIDVKATSNVVDLPRDRPLPGDPDVTDAIGTPAYRQIADELRAQIASGDLPIGTAVPSTAQLVKHYNVSTTVVRAAINQLRRDGLLIGQPGKAVYVQATPQAIADETIRMEDLAARVDTLERALSALTGSGTTLSPDVLQADLADLHRQVADLQTHLIELYNRLGQPYPAPPIEAEQSATRRRRSGR